MYESASGSGGSYRTNDIMTSSPEQLILLLYRRLLVLLRRAEHRITDEGGSEREASEALAGAKAIVFELLASLDVGEGGEFAARLSALYTYFVRELQEAERTGDADRIRTVVSLVEPLHDSWDEGVVRRSAPDSLPAGR